MSIVALKNKYLESRELSKNKKFSLHSSFNEQRVSVKSNSFLLNTQKKWKGVLPNQSELNYFKTKTGYVNIDTTGLRVIYNNWVQPTSKMGTDDSYESYLKTKQVKACLCDDSIDEPSTTIRKSNSASSCIVHKDMRDDSSIYTSKKSKRLVKALECGTLGLNKPFPYNVSGKKLTHTSCGNKIVSQAYMAIKYF